MKPEKNPRVPPARTLQEIRTHLRNTVGTVPKGLPEQIQALEHRANLADMTEFEKLVYYGTQLVFYIFAGYILMQILYEVIT